MTTRNTILEPVTSGDIGVIKVLQLGGVADLDDAASVEAHVWSQALTPSVTTLSASVTDSANRYVSVQLGTAGGWLPTLTVPAREERRYFLDVEVTWNDGGVTTWSTAILPVRGQGA